MTRTPQIEILVRLVVRDPVSDVSYSLQDKRGMPVAATRSAAGETISLDFQICVSAGPKFYGEHVRNEGPERRFVYIAIGRQAGDPLSCWDRRMKIDIHTIPTALLEMAAGTSRLEGTVPGTGKDGSPACATVSAETWRAV